MSRVEKAAYTLIGVVIGMVVVLALGAILP